MVFTHADIVARKEFGAALADDNITGNDGLSAGFFDAQTAASTIATVIG